MSGRKSSLGKSQRSQSKSQRNDGRKLNSSQVQNEVNCDKFTNALVRHVIFHASDRNLFKKVELQKTVLKHCGKSFEKIVKNANEILKDVYGYQIVQCCDSLNNYFVKNILPYKEYNLESSEISESEDPPRTDTNNNNILLLLVLTHVFMSNTKITAKSLYHFLEPFGIEEEKKHPVFGSITECINLMVRHQYLAVETDAVVKKVLYSWGPRAESEISKLDLLKFACKTFNNRSPKSFQNLYQQALDQFEEPMDQSEHNSN